MSLCESCIVLSIHKHDLNMSSVSGDVGGDGGRVTGMQGLCPQRAVLALMRGGGVAAKENE